jgi:hypothetical protein
MRNNPDYDPVTRGSSFLPQACRPDFVYNEVKTDFIIDKKKDKPSLRNLSSHSSLIFATVL